MFRSYAGAPDFHQMTLIQQEQEEASVLMKEDHKAREGLSMFNATLLREDREQEMAG